MKIFSSKLKTDSEAVGLAGHIADVGDQFDLEVGDGQMTLQISVATDGKSVRIRNMHEAVVVAPIVGNVIEVRSYI